MSKIITLIILFGVCLIQNNANAQIKEQPKKEVSKNYNAIRIGVGFEKSGYVEVGYSRLLITDKGLNSGSANFYTSGQFNVVQNGTNIYGGKIGFETSWMIGMWGAELKYLTNNKYSQLYFTPKIGLSLLGAASLLYGYNIPKKDKLEQISIHQISLTLNLNKRLISDFK
jgi:hypothetical protein